MGNTRAYKQFKVNTANYSKKDFASAQKEADIALQQFISAFDSESLSNGEDAMKAAEAHRFVIMGVSGSGKSSIGALLAENIGATFQDSDDFHSSTNKALMAAGISLSNADRLPWLNSIGELLRDSSAEERPIVVACSALKKSYRDVLREFDPDVFFIHLYGSRENIEQRLSIRTHEFMPLSLLDSQFAILEPLQSNERGLGVDIDGTPEEILERISREIS